MLVHQSPQTLRPSRVVVLGAGGFVGNAIAARLEKDGTPVLRLARRDIDLLSPDASSRLGALLRADDVLVAVSAMAPVRNAEMLRDNMILAANIVKAAAAAPLAHVVNISSDAVYGDSAEPMGEDAAKSPDSLHGVMHLARELMFRSEINAPLAMLRPSLLYGAADPHNGYGPNRFRRLAESGEQITLFGKGEERRDHVLIDDVAELAARVIYRRSTGALNIATGAVTSFHDIAALVVRLAGSAAPIVATPRSGPMPHNGYRAFTTAACNAAFPDFAYTPLERGLAQTIAEARAHAP
jgi:nucleoside-diphosphate-sugar epimerase